MNPIMGQRTSRYLSQALRRSTNIQFQITEPLFDVRHLSLLDFLDYFFAVFHGIFH
jgi:hypothetical protein